jgi:integrase
MPRLTALSIKSAEPGKKHGDGNGLFLLVKDSGARSWVLRIQADGKRRDFGLGAVDLSPRSPEATRLAEQIPILDRRLLTLAEAREKAAVFRRMIMAGIDPIEERKKAKAVIPTFEQAARDCHEALKDGWRNARHRASWLSGLEAYAFPSIGSKPVNTVDSPMVRDALAPIWLEKSETANRVLQRIGAVLDFAHVKGWRETGSSLRAVRKGLPKQPQNESHFAAMPYEDVPAFFQSLSAADPTAGRDALRFTILNAVRSNETRFAVWAEFDLDAGVWTIPASRMKMNQTHIVPLAPASIEILRRRWKTRTSNDGLVFFSTPKKVMSDMTMTKILRDSKIEEITVHGFRSSFTDWAADITDFPKEVVDKALAHKLADKVEAAYRRTDFFERRRSLMAQWADFLSNPVGAESSDLPIDQATVNEG